MAFTTSVLRVYVPPTYTLLHTYVPLIRRYANEPTEMERVPVAGLLPVAIYIRILHTGWQVWSRTRSMNRPACTAHGGSSGHASCQAIICSQSHKTSTTGHHIYFVHFNERMQIVNFTKRGNWSGGKLTGGQNFVRSWQKGPAPTFMTFACSPKGVEPSEFSSRTCSR
jgi:hypothetical protein